MGRVGAVGDDNAAMESFFSLLQNNFWTAAAGPPEKRIVIVTWIERTYRRCRCQTALG